MDLEPNLSFSFLDYEKQGLFEGLIKNDSSEDRNMEIFHFLDDLDEKVNFSNMDLVQFWYFYIILVLIINLDFISNDQKARNLFHNLINFLYDQNFIIWIRILKFVILKDYCIDEIWNCLLSQGRHLILSSISEGFQAQYNRLRL